jgi:hypothetical protein
VTRNVPSGPPPELATLAAEFLSDFASDPMPNWVFAACLWSRARALDRQTTRCLLAHLLGLIAAP